jgi:cell division protease FtsH
VNRNSVHNGIILFFLTGLFAIKTIDAAPAPAPQPIKEQNLTQKDDGILEKTHSDEELKELSELMMLKELTSKFILQTIYSKIEALNLMVSNGAVKLTPAQKKRFLANTESTKKELAGAAHYFMSPEKKELLNAIEFNEQLLDYLFIIIKQELKYQKPFVFTPTAHKAIPSNEHLIEKTKAIIQRMQEFETVFNDLGVTKTQHARRKFNQFNKRWGITSKLNKAGMLVFGALLTRYLLKDHTDRDTGKAIKKSNYGDGMLGWIDHTLIGVRQQYENRYNPETSGFIPVPVAGTGTGIFGNMERIWKPLTTVAGFFTALKTANDHFVDGVNGWKGFYKDPKSFFKLGEIFRNEKQSVSPIEELFLLNALEQSVPKITFDHVAGLREQKKELAPVISYLLNPELFEKTGTSVEKGYLLYGPTRTGKTFLAEALAGEIMLKHGKPLAFLKIKGSELRYVGIKKILDIVKKYAPCIVFIDELDLLNLQRDQNTNLLDEFLTGMKTDEDRKQVIFLAATNRIDHIDHALLQPGRFGKIITFENPSFNDRLDFFKQQLARKNINPATVDCQRLANETENCTYGDLSSIINHALTKATHSQQILAYTHFDNGIDVFKRKLAQSNINLPKEEKAIISSHLAGHAIAYMLLPTSEQLHKVTMLPIQRKITEEKIWLSDATISKKITSFGDVFTLHKMNTGGFDSPEQRINKVKALLAGHLAEKLLLGNSAYNYHEDNEAARQIIELMVFKGIKKEHFSKEMANQKLEEVRLLFEKYEAETTQFLLAHKELLQKVASLLENQLTITAEDIALLIAQEKGSAAQK